VRAISNVSVLASTAVFSPLGLPVLSIISGLSLEISPIGGGRREEEEEGGGKKGGRREEEDGHTLMATFL